MNTRRISRFFIDSYMIAWDISSSIFDCLHALKGLLIVNQGNPKDSVVMMIRICRLMSPLPVMRDIWQHISLPYRFLYFIEKRARDGEYSIVHLYIFITCTPICFTYLALQARARILFSFLHQSGANICGPWVRAIENNYIDMKWGLTSNYRLPTCLVDPFIYARVIAVHE